jgi:small subunit ribosomal protein S8
MTDPIADLLTRIRNAQTARLDTTLVPFSKLKQGVVKVLYEEGYIGPYRIVEGEGGRKSLSVSVRYTGKKQALISGIVRESKPGRRFYVGYRKIRPVRSGFGVAILSTPKGILTDRQAKEEKVGGELLCRVW